jgi:hypothetical protein
MTYRPAPLDTSTIVLDPDVEALRERLARHVHDVWAQERLALGWTYGPERNDARREHPSLVPYDALPDAEKVLDRQTASETLKAIIAFGFQIVPAPPRLDP